MRIRSKEGWYVAELRGVCYVTWVSLEDRAHAAIFPDEGADKWVALLSDMTGKDLAAEPETATPCPVPAGIHRNAVIEECAEQCDALYELRAATGFPREASTARALAAALRNMKGAAPVPDARVELVVALHSLASDFENSLYAFGGDAEARRKAEGGIAHAREVATRHNRNGAAPSTSATMNYGRAPSEELNDRERLDFIERKARESRTGVSFDWVPSVEGDPRGYRMMWRGVLHNQARDIRAAIDEAMSKEAPR